MGTRADFYVAQRLGLPRTEATLRALGGSTLDWLGSVGWDGYPDNADYAELLTATSEADFRAAVAKLLGAREDATKPEQGWPWPWEDSRTTDYTYAFFLGRVWVSNYGGPWYLAVPVEHNCRVRAPLPVQFPDMTARRRVVPAGGARSGAMAIRRR